MKRRPTLLQKIWRKLRRPDAAERAKLVKAEAAPRARRSSSLEPLEGRIAPAALINPTTMVYKDIDGDIVTVKFSKSLFTDTPTSVATANLIFKFDTGTVTGDGFEAFDPATAAPQQLQLIDLTKAPVSSSLANLAAGTAITVTAVRGEVSGVLGDGFGNIGYLKATNLSLGKVSIAGDLGQIDAGLASVKTAISSLTVQSLGAKGLATQAATGASLESNIVGGLGALTVAGDVKDASVRVVHGFDISGNLTTLGQIGKVTIAGSLIGTPAVAATSDATGLIQAAGDIGAVKIGSTVLEGIVGGGGQSSGALVAGGTIKSIVVSGDVRGGDGAGSGGISSGASLGPITIFGDLKGSAGAASGSIESVKIGNVTIGNSIIAGTGDNSGLISNLGSLGAVKIGGGVDASITGVGDGAGRIGGSGDIASISIAGTIQGGDAARSGYISTFGSIGALTIGSLHGGSAQNAGTILFYSKIGNLTITGDIIGGTAIGAGSVFAGVDIFSPGDIGAIKIGGRVEGGSVESTGAIIAEGKIASVTIGPANAAFQIVRVKGGGGDFSGAIVSHGGMGAVKIMGNLEGGGGDSSGAIISRDLLNSLEERAGALGAVLVTGHVKGGAGADSGQIRADGDLAKATVGELRGDAGPRSGAILVGRGKLAAGNAGAILINGALAGGTDTASGAVIAEGKITSVTVKGDATGGTIRAGDNLAAISFAADVTATTISARGQAVQGKTADLAIGKIAVTGDVANARFLAGYDTALVAANADAQIGSVIVKGNWGGSDLVAGVLDGGDPGFGTAGDVAIGGFDNADIVSSIANIVIGGNVGGSAAAGDHFGVTAQKIAAFKAANVPPLALNKLADGQSFDVVAGEVTVREIAPPVELSGSGVTKTGSGTLTLAGGNVHSGGTTVSGGTLTVAPGSLVTVNLSTVNLATSSITGITLPTPTTLAGGILASGGTLVTHAGTTTVGLPNPTANGGTMTLAPGIVWPDPIGPSLTLNPNSVLTLNGGTLTGPPMGSAASGAWPDSTPAAAVSS